MEPIDSPLPDSISEGSIASDPVEAEDRAYTAWLRAKVARAVADPRPSVPHEEAMARITARIAARRTPNVQA